jgi:hypothetical protein
MSGTRNPLLGDWFQPPTDETANPLMRKPTYADAAEWHGQNLADTWVAMNDPRMWVNAAQQYGNALLMGTTAPTRLRAFHGSLEDFSSLDRSKVGSGAMSDRWAADAKHADEYYLTTNPEHAEHYGPVVHEFEIGKPLYQKDAKADLEAWAKSEGYDSAQKHLDEYYEGNIYSALDLDNYLKDALSEAKAAGFPGVHVSLGDLKNPRRKPFGDFIVLHDPSVATRVAARQRKD